MSNRITEAVRSELIEEDTFLVNIIDSEKTLLYSTTAKIDNPYDIDYNRLLPNEIGADLRKFFNLTSSLISTAQKELHKVKLIEDFNPEEFKEHGPEVITYRIIKRTPGMMDTKAKGRPQRTYLFSHDLRFAEHPNKVIEVQSMPKDHQIEFSCWSIKASIANRRALWLENLLINHKWVFTSQGVERFNWEERGADRMMLVSGQRLYERPLRFFVRLREFHTVAHPLLSNINLELDIPSEEN